MKLTDCLWHSWEQVAGSGRFEDREDERLDKTGRIVRVQAAYLHDEICSDCGMYRTVRKQETWYRVGP